MTAFESPAAPQSDAAARPVASAGGSVHRQPAGSSSVAAAVARLDGVHELPLHEQPDVYQSVHAELQDALAAIDDA